MPVTKSTCACNALFVAGVLMIDDFVYFEFETVKQFFAN